MKRVYLTVVALALMVAALAHADDEPKTHKLPADGKTPVITLDYQGGMLRRKSQDPVLQVLSDGTAIVGDPFGMGRRVEGKLKPDELQAVLRFILDDMKFNDIKSADLEMKGRARVSDGTTTSISVEADDAKQQLSGYAISTVAAQAGAGSPAERFLKISNRLDMLTRVITLGGADALQKQLDAANAKLKIDLPDESPMQADDLARAQAPAAGGTVATFSRTTTPPNGKWHITAVTVTDDGKDHIKVQVAKGADQAG